MQMLRSIFLSLMAFAVLCGLAFFAASALVIVAVLGSAALMWRLASLPKAKPVPVRNARHRGRQDDVRRVWNDGRGTIIDL